MPTQNHQKRQVIFLPFKNRADGQENQILSERFVVTKAEKDKTQNTKTV